jgi:hypothetical protein
LLEVDLATDDTVGELYMDGVANRIRTGPRSGHKTSMADGNGGLVTDQEPPPAVLRCANYQGFSVHANVAVRASDRKRLESLCKYAARPPLAHERLQETSGGRLVYRMKTPWWSGQTHVVMERIELIEKLAALVPRPRYHIVSHPVWYCLPPLQLPAQKELYSLLPGQNDKILFSEKSCLRAPS